MTAIALALLSFAPTGLALDYHESLADTANDVKLTDGSVDRGVVEDPAADIRRTEGFTGADSFTAIVTTAAAPRWSSGTVKVAFSFTEPNTTGVLTLTHTRDAGKDRVVGSENAAGDARPFAVTVTLDGNSLRYAFPASAFRAPPSCVALYRTDLARTMPNRTQHEDSYLAPASHLCRAQTRVAAQAATPDVAPGPAVKEASGAPWWLPFAAAFGLALTRRRNLSRATRRRRSWSRRAS